MKSSRQTYLILLAAIMLLAPWNAAWAEPDDSEPVLVRAVMCEAVEKLEAVNVAVVFSVELGRISSFTEFDPVAEQTVIYHKWYHRGNLISQRQLTINPPRWSSFSSMQLRGTDIGPWQVDITDRDGNIFRTLRFSITN